MGFKLTPVKKMDDICLDTVYVDKKSGMIWRPPALNSSKVSLAMLFARMMKFSV